MIATATNRGDGDHPRRHRAHRRGGTPDGTRVYVANNDEHRLGDRHGENKVASTIPVGFNPLGVAMTPDGSQVYVAHLKGSSVSVISTASNAVSATIPVGAFPLAWR